MLWKGQAQPPDSLTELSWLKRCLHELRRWSSRVIASFCATQASQLCHTVLNINLSRPHGISPNALLFMAPSASLTNNS